MLFGRSVWAAALWVLASLVVVVTPVFSQTDEIPPRQRCSAASGTEAGEQCTRSERRLSGKALSNAYTMAGISDLVLMDFKLRADPQSNLSKTIFGLWARNFQLAIDVDPSNQRARVCRGLLYLARMQSDPAIADFSEALHMEPKDYDLLIARAKAYTLKQYLRRALDDLNRAIEVDPMKAAAFGFRGDVFRLVGWPGRAYADYNNAVKREPDVAVWVERRNAAAKLLGRRGKARQTTSAASGFPTTVIANFVPGQNELGVSDTLKRWEAGEVSLQEARQLFERATPRCILHYL